MIVSTNQKWVLPGDTIDTASSGAHIHLVLQVLFHLLQAPQLVVQGVDDDPGEQWHAAEDEPGEETEDVVAEDEIIDNGAVAEVDDPPEAEAGHGTEPGDKACLILKPHGVDEEAGGDEESNGAGDAEEGGHDEDVPDVVVADIHELVADPVVSCVNRSRGGLLQTIDIEHRLKNIIIIINIIKR